MPPDAAREIKVPGTELRLPGRSFACYQLTSVITRAALRQENGQPTGVHVHLHLRYIVALPRRRPATSERTPFPRRGLVTSGRTGSHRRGQAVPGKYGP